MTPIRTVLVLAFLLAAGGSARAGDGDWSPYAVAVPSQRSFSYPSPDRVKTIVISNRELTVLEGRLPLGGAERIGLLLPAEIIWSSDSKAFVLTSSDGGPTGTWDAALFLQDRDRFNYYGISEAAIDLFVKEFPCTSPLIPNVGALRFLKPSKELLLAVEAPLQSSCGTRSAVRGFIVEVPSGAVLRELEWKDLLEDWGETLGPRFDVLRKQTAGGRAR